MAEILKHALPGTQIVYCKAKAAAEFRHCWDFVKVRELNDYHHAKDAYINIIVGNMYNTKFTSNPGWFIKAVSYTHLSRPIWLSTCFAIISMATLARNRLVPIPAVAQIPVFLRTVSMRKTAISLGVFLYRWR